MAGNKMFGVGECLLMALEGMKYPDFHWTVHLLRAFLNVWTGHPHCQRTAISVTSSATQKTGVAAGSLLL